MDADSAHTPVIVAAKRTPQGREDGALSSLRSEDLSIAVIDALLEAVDLDPDVVDDLQWGCAQQRGEQDNNLARVVALLSDLGEDTPAATINRWCASSMEAIANAANAIRAGQRRVVLAGGVESMSRVPMNVGAAHLHPGLADRYDVEALQMGVTAETVAETFGVDRATQDAYALRSHRRAAAATDEGRFDAELVPVSTETGVLETDEGIRRETDLDQLAALPSVFVDDGTVTAGNASQISDGAAGVLLTSEAVARERGLPLLARVGRYEVAGVEPTIMGVGPVPATERMLAAVGRSIEDYNLVELNEAFASQTVHARRSLGVPGDRFNVNGGAIAIGHPLGASGARLVVTLVHELGRRGGTRGIATLCVGFGQGAAIEVAR